MSRLIVALLGLVLLVGCGPSAEQLQATVEASVAGTSTAATATAEADVCGPTKLANYADAIERQLELYQRQAGVVGAAPRMSMGVPLQELSNLHTATEDMERPECLSAWHDDVTSMMTLYEVAYQSFAAQGNETVIQTTLTFAESTRLTLLEQISIIRAGNVPPEPEVVDPAEPGVVSESRVLLITPGTSAKGFFHVCPSDTFETYERQTIGEATWAHVRLTAVGADCSTVLIHATIDSEGWLLDSDVLAP